MKQNLKGEVKHALLGVVQQVRGLSVDPVRLLHIRAHWGSLGNVLPYPLHSWHIPSHFCAVWRGPFNKHPTLLPQPAL